MSKRTVFTSITPLPPGISRQTAIDFLHNHRDMIDLNPLVTDRHVIPPPPHALPEEHVCTWYSITDKISYLPGQLVTGAISYTAAFHDLPLGLQTHCHAPMGVDLREKWTVGGSEPGEDPEPMELGLGAPRSGLYIREDVVITCNIMMASFIKKTIKKAHGTLIEALSVKAASSGAPLIESQAQMRYRKQTPYPASAQTAEGQQLRSLRLENLRKPLPARPTSWQTPPTPPMASLSTEVFQYRDQDLDTSGVDYGYPPEPMAPRSMRTPPHAYVPELL
ncbi:hypothetical protein TsFJ059_007342 [Trichoderma semiorbis]|uniref:DUF7053 domain-containing protein n=1 Tax=Trichoderma semiorbis TaxID=1491008 RepID=A0A9P8HGN1_9HYPO|nr:hypothetical protein TsFJ059_007342 [Trichoderma semiorbis]